MRLALDPEGRVVVDLRGRLPGRGAWVHPGCLRRVEERPGLLKRSLKIVPAAGPWVQAYRAAVERALEDGLSQAAAAGALVGGQERLVRALQQGTIRWVVLASDVAPATERRLRGAASEDVPFVRSHLDTGALGERVGKGPRSAIGVERSRAATHLVRQLRRLRRLG